jgi:antirestriction protein ArdC
VSAAIMKEESAMAENSTRKQVKEITDRLEAGMSELFTSDKYLSYLKTMSRFHKYSTRNTLLIYMQKPDASLVAGYQAWQTKFGRYVKRGEKGIKIFAPTPFLIEREEMKLDPNTRMPVLDESGVPVVETVEQKVARFKATSVFDISQTDGKPLPTLVENLTGDVRQYELFVDSLRAVSPLPIGFEALPPETDGLCRIGENIAIREGMSEIQTIVAIVHEITHAKLHSDIVKEAAEGLDVKSCDRRTEEVQAESVAYAVCQYYGIETGANSFGYLAEWSKNRKLNELTASLDIIRKTASELIEDIDRSFRQLAKERGIDATTRFERAAEVPEVTESQEKTIPPQKEEKLAVQYTEFQEKGFAIAKSYASLPLQDRLNIIAQTFGCQTAHIETHPCTKKWYNMSDITIVFDNGVSNGMSLFIGTHQTPEAENDYIINMYVNKTLAIFNPQTVAEAKHRATLALMEREAADAAIAAKHGLEPYKFLNVEMDDSTNLKTDRYLGWYYVTLAVGDKIFGHLTSDLNADIARGVVGENDERRDYYIAGGLQKTDVNYIFDNVGHSTFGEEYKIELSENTLQRARETLARRERFQDALQGIKATESMVLLDKEYAFALFDAKQAIYLLHPDDTEVLAFDREEIENHDGPFGAEQDDYAAWKDAQVPQTDEAVRESENQRESELLFGKEHDGMFGIYQLNDGEELHNHRFASIAQLEADGLAIERGNYRLVYSAPLTVRDTMTNLHKIFADYQGDRPEDYLGHSPSVSDVIVLRWREDISAHYVDNLGFKGLPLFTGNESQPQARTEPENAVPTVAELEADVREGKPVSLMDLASALKKESSPQTVYYGPPETARANGELEAYRGSARLNSECADAIDSAIRTHYDGHHLGHDAPAEVLDKYGSERLLAVLANTVLLKEYDGRFSAENKVWAHTVRLPQTPDGALDRRYFTDAHPAVLDGFIRQARRMCEERKPSIMARLQEHEKRQQAASRPDPQKAFPKRDGLEV